MSTIKNGTSAGALYVSTAKQKPSVTVSAIYIYMEPGWRSLYTDWLRAGRPSSWSSRPGRFKNFIFSTSSRPAMRSNQFPIQWVPGVLFPRVKRPGREDDHSPPASIEINKMWNYTSIPPYSFMA
jgi:hypothetical protein